MRRKLLAVLLSTACVLLAAGCGAVGSETAAPTEEAGEAQEDDSQSAEAAESAETEEPGATEGEETADSEEQEAVQEESDPNAIIWYMDEEGMKSGELGMMLRLDSEKRRELSLSQYMYVFSEEMGRQQNFECGYYDGSLDNYIAENAGFEKAMLDDCEERRMLYLWEMV